MHIIVKYYSKTAQILGDNGNVIADLTHDDAIKSVAFSPDGQKIITASNDKNIKIWQLNGHLLYTLSHGNSIRSAAFSPDGHKIITASKNNTMMIWLLPPLDQSLFWLSLKTLIINYLSSLSIDSSPSYHDFIKTINPDNISAINNIIINIINKPSIKYYIAALFPDFNN